MLRKFLGLVFLASCTMGTVSTGGSGNYKYTQESEHSLDWLKTMAPNIIVTSRRDPPSGKLDKLFGVGRPPLKRYGILVFESRIRATPSGLSTKDRIFLSEQGKQLLTEGLLQVWEESLTTLAPELDYVGMSKMMKAPSYDHFGVKEVDFVQANRESMAPDDIFFLDKGKKLATTAVINPRGARDMSLLFVPAYELMGGPKWSEQHKQFVNEVMKDLHLDAVLIVMSDLTWTSARIDKHSGEAIPEEIKLSLMASTLISLSEYRKRAESLGISGPPSVNLCYRAYEGKLRLPARLSVPEEEQNFATIEKELLAPLMKGYRDLTVMMAYQMTNDLKKTH